MMQRSAKRNSAMTITKPNKSNEFSTRGKEIYDRSIRTNVEANHSGEFVAIDIDSGAWEVDLDDFTATERLLARLPEARIWLMRVGSEAAYRIGGSRAAEKN